MRLHRTHSVLTPWTIGETIVDAARLVAVRIEPVLRQRRPAFALDLCLAYGDRLTVIPTVLVDPPTVVERDRDPLVFPAGTPGDDAFALALTERVLPHLESLVLDGAPVSEHVVRFGSAERFDRARAAGCFGAVPLRESLLRLAPYAYARRFVRGRAVRIDAPDAAGGWALLRDGATAGVEPARRVPAETAWYGEPPPPAARADVAIVARDAACGDAPCVIRIDPALDGTATGVVEIVDPLPLDVGISFDGSEGPARRWIAVERAIAAPSAPSAPYAATGGSSGRIAVVLGRADAERLPSADTDEADALIATLRAEGFDASLAHGAEGLDGADLVHVLGARDGRRVRAIVDAARRAGVPVAVHAFDEDAAAGGWWGAAVTRHCFEYGSDERDVAAYLALLARRAVSVGDARADVPYAPAAIAAGDADAALRDASVVFANGVAEADAIRARTGRTGPIEIVPPVPAAALPGDAGALAGPDRFVLAHAPIGPLGNALMLARCAREAGVPLVVAGPVADASYLERVREFGGPGLVLLAHEPLPGVASALRARAAVVADPAWLGDGGSRLAASALAGAVLVVADRRRVDLPDIPVRRFDPADAAALTRALGEAWDEALRARRTDARERAGIRPETSIAAVVRGYAVAAAAARRPAQA